MNWFSKVLVMTLFGLSTLATRADDWVRPGWLSDCLVNIKESYDNNVFLSGVSTPPAYTVPAGSVAALKNAASWITTVSPKVGVDFAPLLGVTNRQLELSLAYSPDFVFYHDQNSESYNAQRVLTAIKAQNDFVKFNAGNNFTYFDGDRYGPLYPGNLYSGFATIFDRARRRQILEIADVSLQFDYHRWFVRPVASLIYNDMMTEELNTVLPQNRGYQNYADREDVNGGADVGYRITDDFAMTVGYRYGQQFQEQYAFSPDSAPNSYQRILFGLEGHPWHWLSVSLVCGPDFRSYQGDTTTHVTPVKDFHPVKYYGEALITATITKDDSISFKYKYWQWLAGCGKFPYTDEAYELNYHHQFNTKLGFNLGGKFMAWDFDDNLPSAVTRCDLQYTCAGGVTYAVNPHLNLNLGCAFNWGRNDESNLANASTREYNEQLYALGAAWKF
jgi:hypothetical protein